MELAHSHKQESRWSAHQTKHPKEFAMDENSLGIRRRLISFRRDVFFFFALPSSIKANQLGLLRFPFERDLIHTSVFEPSVDACVHVHRLTDARHDPCSASHARTHACTHARRVRLPNLSGDFDQLDSRQLSRTFLRYCLRMKTPAP